MGKDLVLQGGGMVDNVYPDADRRFRNVPNQHTSKYWGWDSPIAALLTLPLSSTFHFSW